MVNYGKTLPSYSLDWISETELGIKKLVYKEEGLSLDGFYESDPIEYFKYNLIDVILPKKLNEKLQHIDLHNLLKRDMKTPMTLSLRGSSALFDTYFSYELERKNIKMRYGVIQEGNTTINATDISEIPKPNSAGVVWNLEEITSDMYRSITGKFPGAYVKESPNNVYNRVEHGVICDLDASSLYPSMMKQNNISFDVYYGRVIDPICYKVLGMLNNVLGTSNNYTQGIHNGIFDTVNRFVNNTNPKFPPKNDYKQAAYYIIMHHLLQLKKVNKPLEVLYNPKNKSEYFLLKYHLLPLLDLVVDISPSSQEFNTFAHDYLLNNEISSYNDIYIFEYPNSPNTKINKIQSSDFQQYLISNNICLNISGALFYTHDHKLGLVYNFLEDRINMRKEYKKKMYDYPVGSDDYKFYNARQLAMKVNANSSYGLTGMSLFRYSNRFLAKSTTVSGRLTLKLAQNFGDIYLKSLAT